MVFKNGESAKSGFLICKILKNSLPGSRFGFVVSKKISNKATVRNKVKRLLRNSVFSQLGLLKKTVDVVMIVLPGIEKKEFLDIQNMVAGALKKLKVIL